MPRQESPRLKISYGWLRGEDYWGDPMSDNMLLSDALTHPFAESMTMAAPPDIAVEGVQYILPKEPTGNWTNYPDALATFHGDSRGWFIVSAFRGLRVDVKDVGFVFYDGESWKLESAVNGQDPEAGSRYDILVSVGYEPVPAETLLYLPVATSLLIPADARGSYASTRNPPSIAVSLVVRRNGTQVGNVIFSPTSFFGTFVFPAAVVLAPADRIEVVCPDNMPANFSVFGFTLRATVIE